jgi:hypothetical protein
MCTLTTALLTRNDPGSVSRGLASTPNVLFAQRLQTGPVMPLRQSGSVLDLVIAHADAFTLREATRQSGASISAAFDGCGSTLFAPGSFPRWTSPVHKVAYKIIRASPPR